MKKLWNYRWLRVLTGILLAAALLAPSVLPALRAQPQEPENPIREENIQPVKLLSFGDGDGGTRAVALLLQEDGTSGNGSQQQDEQPPEEQETGSEQLPQQPQPVPEQTQAQQNPDNQPGEDSADLPGDAGQTETDDAPDLGLVLMWYRYGGERYRSLCPADETVRQDIRAAQLPDGVLRYELELRGLDAVDAELTDVQLAEGSGALTPADTRGSISMQVGPQGEDSYYTLRAQAVCTRTLEDGTRQEQQLSFCFLLVYSDSLDLEARLQWTRADGTADSLRCQPDSQAARTIKNDELNESLLHYSFRLDGQNAEDAKILSATYQAASGESGTMVPAGGALTLTGNDDSENTYTISLLTEVTSGGRTRQLRFTFYLNWREEQDVKLNLVWMKNSTEAQTLVCEPGGRASAEIRRTDLKLGEFSYQLKLDGKDQQQASIHSATLTAEGGEAQALSVPGGSTTLRIPDGAASIKYVLSAQVRCQRSDGSLKTLTFTYVLRYSGDVSLELQYTLLNGTAPVIRCANGQTKTAQTVYSDELADGTLPFSMTLTGGDAGSGVQITKITCYQSGSGRTITLNGSSGSVGLLVNEDGSEGENTLTVTAQSASGEQYTFKVNIPYKLRGDGVVKITTNLDDTETIKNNTRITLNVTAWSEKKNDGTRIAQMTASDTIVTLDGVVQSCDGTAGGRLQYTLVPSDPETGDEIEHTLVITCEDAYGNRGEKTLILRGERTRKGEPAGHASIYIDMTALGLGVTQTIDYEVLSGEAASYSVAKAVWGYDAGDPFGTAASSFGWPSSEAGYNNSFDIGFYLTKLGDGTAMGSRSNALRGSWSDYGMNREEILARIGEIFGEESPYTALWRSIYLAGLELNPCHETSVGQFDFTRGSGWMYAIGGGTAYPVKGLSEYELQDGDVLVLRYTLAYGRDIGDAGQGSTFCVSAVNGSLSVSHQWQQTTDSEGAELTVCASCGKIRACEHPQTEYRETEDGTMCYEYCLKCKKPVTEPAEHDWQIEQIENDEENHKKTCKNCKKEETEAHRYEFIEDTATCEQAGEIVSRCIWCSYEKRTPSEQLSHKPAMHVDQHEHWQVCEVCGQEIENSRGTHRYSWDEMWSDWVCEACGYSHTEACSQTPEPVTEQCTCSHEVRVCSVCGQKLERDGVFEQYPHEYELVESECTCSLEVKRCVRCGKRTEEPGVYENYPHSYVDGFCRFCGAPEPAAPEPTPEPEPAPGPEYGSEE